MENSSPSIIAGKTNPLRTLRVVGARSAFWYAVYSLQLRLGIARRRTPLSTWNQIIDRLPNNPRSWNPDGQPFFFFDDPLGLGAPLRRISPSVDSDLQKELENAGNGSFRLWEDSYHRLGFPPEWNRNPLSGRLFQADQHWTEVDERSGGDIKGVWELSRFAIAFRLARCYAATADERAPEAFWRLFESWLAENPPNAGPQWLSAQEAALRAMAWIFALRAFARSPATTQTRAEKMTAALQVHARRIDATLAYARAQNNNHLISEAAGLFTVGLMLPELPEAAGWLERGRSLLEKTAAQFYSDGGYIQHSHNYHRLALQLYLWAMRLAERNLRPFSERIYRYVDRSLEMLSKMVDPQTGAVPNFGHNDGALFLPLNACGYEDYRPLLQSLSLWRGKGKVFEDGAWDEDALWLLGEDSLTSTGRAEGTERMQSALASLQPLSAPEAGLYVLAGEESRAVIRCARFHSRPAHSDQLHVDLWWRGENIACDAGSYLYSGDPPWQNSLAFAAVHNTVTVDGLDPMRRTGRFRWDTLAQGRVDSIQGSSLSGRHDGYRRMGIYHSRSVKCLAGDVWIVTDTLEGKGVHSVRLHWLVPDYPWEWVQPSSIQFPKEDALHGKIPGPFETLCLKAEPGNVHLAVSAAGKIEWSLYRAGEAVFGGVERGAPVPPEIRGWRSLHYASKIPALSVACIIQGEFPLRILSLWKLNA